MSNRLAMLTAVLVLVLVASAPALAQNGVPACELDDACLDTSEVLEATADQYTESPEPGQAPSDSPTPEIPGEDSNDDQYIPDTGNVQSSAPEAALAAPASCGSCGMQVAQSAQDAIAGGGSSDTDSTYAFGAALQAARDAWGTRETAASEEVGTPVKETAVYQAAFKAAKEAGADDETAKEAAEQAVGEADNGRADKAKGKDRKKRAVEDKAREDMTEEEEEEDAAYDEVDGGNDNPGTGDADTADADTAATPTGSRVPLLFGGVAFLSVGGFAALRLARSWSSSDLKLPRN